MLESRSLFFSMWPFQSIKQWTHNAKLDLVRCVYSRRRSQAKTAQWAAVLFLAQWASPSDYQAALRLDVSLAALNTTLRWLRWNIGKMSWRKWVSSGAAAPLHLINISAKQTTPQHLSATLCTLRFGLQRDSLTPQFAFISAVYETNRISLNVYTLINSVSNHFRRLCLICWLVLGFKFII